jgi:hypothetical protein
MWIGVRFMPSEDDGGEEAANNYAFILAQELMRWTHPSSCDTFLPCHRWFLL